MPVADHEIHPRTRHGADFRYGCFNRPDKFKMIVRGAECYGGQEWPFVNTHECRFDLSANDAGCGGCRHAKADAETQQ
jgi:hypothetical protein